MNKTLVGPKLRQIRRQHNHSQAEMARRLGVSAAYVNLLESNQRSLTVQVLMALTEAYGLDTKTIVQDSEATLLSDLRSAVRAPVFSGEPPDLQELRAAIDHAPNMVERFLSLYQNHRQLADQVQRNMAGGEVQNILATSPETAIHDFFRRNENHFDSLERTAEDLRARIGGATDDMYALLKRHLRIEHGVQCEIRPLSELQDALRDFDATSRKIYLSEALDPTNRVFQLAYMLGQLEAADGLSTLVKSADFTTELSNERLRVELTNYFAAAFLMPYGAFLEMAQLTRYDLDRLAAAFGVSFEQVSHRLTTLQRDGARGIPFFFLRVDRAGNVTKRFNATGYTLAKDGGACPVWDMHAAFRMPGVIIPQFVELPEGERFFTLSRTTDRPVFSRDTQDRRLVVTVGCDAGDAQAVGYAQPFNLQEASIFAPIGINCHMCARQNCSQRAHQPLHMKLSHNVNRRGQTRYES